MIRGAIFDMDGVLLDSMPVWDKAGGWYIESQGKVPEEGLTEVLFTKSMHESARYMQEHYQIAKSEDEIVAGVIEVIHQQYAEMIPAKSGVIDFLRRLKEAGVQVTVATSSDRVLAKAGLTRVGAMKYIDTIFTCNEIGKSKEHPDVYLEAWKSMKIAKEETWVFEDVLHGIRTAKEAGFQTVGVYDASSDANTEKIYQESVIYLKDFTDFEAFYRKASQIRTALTIAGSDSSGGAGIQADIKTMLANGVYAMSAITALTAQNTMGVTGIMEVSAEFLEKELDAVFTDIFPDAVKIGMVSNATLIRTIAERLKRYQAKNIVVDPVMVSTSGSRLLQDEAVAVLQEELLPMACVVTPNIPEAEILAQMTISSKEDMETAAEKIGQKYRCSVLLKGGHALNDANDFLWQEDKKEWFTGRRIDNPNTHGTGCTLSSAIASGLAKGKALSQAIIEAKEYLSGALADGMDLGKGSGPLNHGFALK